jgi:hypothetical protein
VDVAELVDALDLGPSNFVVRVRVSPSTVNFQLILLELIIYNYNYLKEGYFVYIIN